MIGKVLGGRYEIIEQVGGGGMALVYKAKCNLLNRYVAIKILRNEFLEDEDFIRKFKRESQAAASLSHPNILNIYDVGVEEINGKDIHYIVMELIKGKTLKQIIREKGKLSFDETINYSIQIAEALKHAHANHIVHRDIKPQNIMVTEENRIKVTDFGIARAATSATLTTTSDALGSVHYFSPEQARGGYTDEKSDIYSLGIVMYEMITGKLPYDGETPISVALKHIQDDIVPPSMVEETVPDNLESIILKCVEKKQIDRYNNVGELIRDLGSIKNNVEGAFIADTDNSDSPTRVIPIITDEIIDEMVESPKEKKKENKKKKDKKKKGDGGIKVILLAILLAFVLVTGVFAGLLKLKDIFQVSEVIVPNLIGMQEELAKQEVEDLGLKFEVQGTTKNSDFDPGDVVTQNVSEGTKVKEGYTIKVVINEGEDLVRVPGLVNKTLEEAEALLRAVGLEIGTANYTPSDITPADMIMRQEPEASTYLESGSRVNVVISKGEEIKPVIMPKLTGMNIIDAKNTLLGLGLVPGNVKEQASNEFAKDLVIWQAYESGTELENKTVVDLYISSGPEVVEEPVEEEPVEEEPPNNKDNQGNEDKEGPFKINITIPTDKEETVVKVIRKQDGTSTVEYNKPHQASEGETSINVKGKIGAEFEVYFDDIREFTIEKKE